MDFGLQLIKNTRDFETALGEWNKRPDNQKTWELFKEHFQDAQQTLKDIRGPTMAQARFHHANHLASEIRGRLQENQQQMLALLRPHTTEEPYAINNECEESQQQNALATTQLNVQTETLKLLSDLQKQLQNLTTEVKKKNDGGRRRQNRKTPDNPPFSRTNIQKYCWTHGACNHNSNECTRKAPGHKDEATKTNKLRGSKAFCE